MLSGFTSMGELMGQTTACFRLLKSSLAAFEKKVDFKPVFLALVELRAAVARLKCS